MNNETLKKFTEDHIKKSSNRHAYNLKNYENSNKILSNEQKEKLSNIKTNLSKKSASFKWNPFLQHKKKKYENLSKLTNTKQINSKNGMSLNTYKSKNVLIKQLEQIKSTVSISKNKKTGKKIGNKINNLLKSMKK